MCVFFSVAKNISLLARENIIIEDNANEVDSNSSNNNLSIKDIDINLNLGDLTFIKLAEL